MITKNNGEISAVIVAAGSGRRMGGISKPEIVIRGKTLFARVLEVFSAMPEITRIIAVCSTENRARLETIAARAGIAAEFVPGGETRLESVLAGLRAGVTALYLMAIIAGAVIYRTVIACALTFSFLKATDLKIITAIIVAFALALPVLQQRSAERKLRRENAKKYDALIAQELGGETHA